jgi:16S rRNA (adenine1518-N6/adenine1519-N6)-dimethyltransferase
VHESLPPLRDVIARHGLAARRSLGQHFLLDANLTRRIVQATGPLAGRHVAEVGPGPGGLTRALLASDALSVTAVEIDPRAVAAMHELAEEVGARLHVVEGDALAMDLAALVPAPRQVVANLPYNIATPLLISWVSIEPWPPWFDRAVLMFQREVAERIVAEPGSKTYGRLSVLLQWRCETRILFDINPSAFVPPPKVTSSVLQIVPRPAPASCDRRFLEAVTQAAFGQRRKMLRQSLRSLDSDLPALLADTGLDPTARAEDIPVEGFVALARALAAQRAAR